MPRVTVSPKYQVVIPKELRTPLHVRPGQKMEVFLLDGVLELVPVEHPSQLRGFLRGMDPHLRREETDRL